MPAQAGPPLKLPKQAAATHLPGNPQHLQQALHPVHPYKTHSYRKSHIRNKMKEEKGVFLHLNRGAIAWLPHVQLVAG